jgi:hypothetical protein
MPEYDCVSLEQTYPRKSFSIISKAAGSLGCVSTVDSRGEQFWLLTPIDEGKRVIVRTEEINRFCRA